jgi:predicted lipase
MAIEVVQESTHSKKQVDCSKEATCVTLKGKMVVFIEISTTPEDPLPAAVYREESLLRA